MGIADKNISTTVSNETTDNTTLGADNGSFTLRNSEVTINQGSENPQAPFFPSFSQNRVVGESPPLISNPLLLAGLGAGLVFAFLKFRR